MDFNYQTAFIRNLGWVTPQEQEVLRHSRVAIAGLGGVGGIYLMTLARLGVGKFNLAEYDKFELSNFNRQAGAFMSTIGQSKIEVMIKRARDINPELEINAFQTGVTNDNIEEFLKDADVYVDGIDFFATEARELIFNKCAELSIPAVTAAPIGMSTALLVYMPGGMTFEEYFRFKGLSPLDKAIHFLAGLSPRMAHRHTIRAPEYFDFVNRKTGSTPMGCDLCAGFLGTTVLKILLKRGKIDALPYSLHFEAYQNKLVKTWRPGGNKNPLNQLIIKLLKKNVGQAKPSVSHPSYSSTIERILNIARWAPSGDNTQPWRFEIKDDRHLIIRGLTPHDNIYHLANPPFYLSMGFLLESIAIAATAEKLAIKWSIIEEKPTEFLIDVHFEYQENLTPDPLLPYIPIRSVNRRALSMRHLTKEEKRKLQSALGSDHEALFFDGFWERFKWTHLIGLNFNLQLNPDIIISIYKQMVDWNSQFSQTKIPDQALGLNFISLKLMKWALDKKENFDFLSKYVIGAKFFPKIELGYIPGLFCGAFFAIKAKQTLQTAEDFINAGRASQRFWLMATKLGLQLQPVYLPIMFSNYIRKNITFSSNQEIIQLTEKIKDHTEKLIGKENFDSTVFMGRIGEGPSACSRSTRLPLEQLLYRNN